MKFSIKFFNHRFAFICRILKIRKIHSKHEWQHLFQRYAANATMIAVTFPARRSPLTGVSKWNDLDREKIGIGYVGWKWKIRENIRFLRSLVEDALLYSRHTFLKKNKYWCFNSIFHRRMSRG